MDHCLACCAAARRAPPGPVRSAAPPGHGFFQVSVPVDPTGTESKFTIVSTTGTESTVLRVLSRNYYRFFGTIYCLYKASMTDQ